MLNRFKLEEHHQRRERELEIYQEQERRREREREREREKEREASSDLILLSEQEKGLKSPWPHNNRRAESPGEVFKVVGHFWGKNYGIVKRF